MGIETRLADHITPEAFEKLIDGNTKALYFESIGNPGFVVPDFEAFGKL
ncbi:MAG TPA: PLP-dependent transferase, partial [Treponemataceae bacterium]|nr:PLP-dependent transferase [Treponemataceae bacterium]